MVNSFVIDSEIGSVLVGTKDFRVLIPNGYGDGETLIKVGTKEDFKNINKEFWTVLDGKFNVYENDCNNDSDIIITLEGRYFIYYYDGTVYFEKV